MKMKRQNCPDAKTASQRVWGAVPAGWDHARGIPVGTKQYFEQVLRKRSFYEVPWLFEIFPFASTLGKKVLEVGCGAGYDAYEFCRKGAIYTGVDITPENIERTRKHLDLYELTGDIRQGDAERLDFPDELFDIVFSNGVLHHVPDIEQSLKEIHRVLREGGEFWLTLYHRNSIFYRISLGLWDHLLCGGFLRQSFRERLQQIEVTTSAMLPLVNAYSKREVANMLERACFTLRMLEVRKLVWEDLPGIPILSRCWRLIPQGILDRLGRVFGWYIVVRAEKRKTD